MTPRHRPGRRALIPAILTVAVTVSFISACSKSATTSGTPGSLPQASTSVSVPKGPFDVRPLLKPRHKYLGAAIEGVPASLGPEGDFARRIGKKPNVLSFYVAYGDDYNVTAVTNAWSVGALPFIQWEPNKPSLAQIAGGATDGYLTRFATAVMKLNIPVAIDFGHEMNGNWYSWGTTGTTPTDFVRAWRHIHNVFLNVGAANVIWVWNPNVINPLPNVALRPFYPGDSYVDWIGMVGYYSAPRDYGWRTFNTLFGPTMRDIRRFSRRPFIITETSAEPSVDKARAVADLFNGVARNPSVIGFIWFDYVKRADWRIENDPPALAVFRWHARLPLFGFDVASS